MPPLTNNFFSDNIRLTKAQETYYHRAASFLASFSVAVLLVLAITSFGKQHDQYNFLTISPSKNQQKLSIKRFLCDSSFLLPRPYRVTYHYGKLFPISIRLDSSLNPVLLFCDALHSPTCPILGTTINRVYIWISCCWQAAIWFIFTFRVYANKSLDMRNKTLLCYLNRLHFVSLSDFLKFINDFSNPWPSHFLLRIKRNRQ